jgi:hypothetical protein
MTTKWQKSFWAPFSIILPRENSSIQPGKMYSSLTTALILFAFLKTAASIPHGSPPSTSNPTGPPYLNELAQKHGKLWFGTAADIPGPEQQDEGYMSILNDTKIFGEITPANYMKVNLMFNNSFQLLMTAISLCSPNPNKMFSTSQEATLSST